MIEYIHQPRKLLLLSNYILSVSSLMLILGIALAYFFESRLTLIDLVAAHTLTILGPTVIKIGYIVRLIAEYQIERERYVCA